MDTEKLYDVLVEMGEIGDGGVKGIVTPFFIMSGAAIMAASEVVRIHAPSPLPLDATVVFFSGMILSIQFVQFGWLWERSVDADYSYPMSTIFAGARAVYWGVALGFLISNFFPVMLYG